MVWWGLRWLGLQRDYIHFMGVSVGRGVECWLLLIGDVTERGCTQHGGLEGQVGGPFQYCKYYLQGIVGIL